MYTGEHVTGNGKITSENRTVANAEKVNVAGDIDVILATGPTSIKVEADDNILSYITTQMNDDALEISTRDNINISSDHPIRVYVTSPHFTGISITGSGNVSAAQKIQTDEPMVCAVTGSGNLEVPVHTPRIKASITGSGNIRITGETRDIEVSVTGSGDFEGIQLRAEHAKVNIAGSGNVSVYANTKLDAHIQGSGDVKYKGAASVQQDIGGSGSVRKVE
jgi:hypothetical protein